MSGAECNVIRSTEVFVSFISPPSIWCERPQQCLRSRIGGACPRNCRGKPTRGCNPGYETTGFQLINRCLLDVPSHHNVGNQTDFPSSLNKSRRLGNFSLFGKFSPENWSIQPSRLPVTRRI